MLRVVRLSHRLIPGLLVGTLLMGCQAAPTESAGTDAASGDLLYGRLPAGRELQAFSFEGVEGSMVDFDVSADGGNVAAPTVELIDPTGKRLDVTAATGSPLGAASMHVRDVVLLRNGIYKVHVRPTRPSTGVWYRFSHRLKFPDVPGSQVRLSAGADHPIYVSAPRRGLIAVSLKPARGSDVVPEFRAVTDPWGGRALDPAQVPAGANPPRLSRGFGGERILTFTAPRPGRYKILAAAKGGTQGVALYSVEVRPPAEQDRIVYHPNTAPQFGVPGNRHRAAPGPLPTGESGAQPTRAAPPPPPPPARVPVAPLSPLPSDPALATR